MVHPVQVGKRTRMSFAKVKDVTEMPNLIEVQLDSYEWFLREGLLEVFDDVNPISNFTGNLVLEFVDYKLDMDNIKYSVEECKERDCTYAAPLKVSVRLTNNETGEIKEQEVFMGDFPLMTEQGTFIINGAERVVVSQLVRSPGVYYSNTIDKSGKKLFASTVIPNRGAWLEYETDSNDVIYVRIDKTRKLPISILARAMGYGSDQELLEYFGEEERFKATIEKDNTKTREEALLEIYKRLRPGEPPTVESASSLINALFFDAKRYDLAKVGRYKFNKKLALCYRIMNKISAEDVVNPETGEEVMYNEEGELYISSPALFKGYYKNEEATNKEIVLDENGEKWIKTGDYFTVAPNGELFFKGRKKMMFVRPDGHNNHPLEMTELVLKHPAVKDAFTVGIQSPYDIQGKYPKVSIVLKDEYKGQEEQIQKELEDLCMSNFSQRDVPYYYNFRDEIPYTPGGKIDCISLE